MERAYNTADTEIIKRDDQQIIDNPKLQIYFGKDETQLTKEELIRRKKKRLSDTRFKMRLDNILNSMKNL